MENQTMRVWWQGKPVLTTVQLAQAYNCDPKNISYNFKYSQKYFIEGKHYFKLTGDDLRKFKAMLKQENGQSDLFEASENAETSLSGFPRMAEIGQALNLEAPKVHQYAAWVYLWTYEGCVRHCKMLNTPEAWKMFGVLEQVYFCVLKAVSAPVSEEAQIEIEALKAENARLRNQLPQINCIDFALVYILLMSNGAVKIGVTGNFNDRIRQIRSETGLNVLDCKTTPIMPRDDALKLEAKLKAKYADRCLVGEYFDVNFLEVCEHF